MPDWEDMQHFQVMGAPAGQYIEGCQTEAEARTSDRIALFLHSTNSLDVIIFTCKPLFTGLPLNRQPTFRQALLSRRQGKGGPFTRKPRRERRPQIFGF